MKHNRILIVSPHLDDAVFSCGNHVLEWKRKDSIITIATVFTRFRSASISACAALYMKNSGASDVVHFESIRNREDIAAMALLGVNGIRCGYVDAGFRMDKNGSPCYPTTKRIFNGLFHSTDMKMVDDLFMRLDRIVQSNAITLIIGPMGIGNHVDHVITHRAVLRVTRCKKAYYLDLPYARTLYNWNLRQLTTVLTHRKTFAIGLKEKESLIQCYKSQTSLISAHNLEAEMIIYE